MLCCLSLEILNNFEQGATPHFHFALGPANYIAGLENESPYLILRGLLNQQSEDLGLTVPASFDFSWVFTQGFCRKYILKLEKGSTVTMFLDKTIDDAANAPSHLC